MQINIIHLYPDFLNLYGDRGNIRTLEKRLNRRGIVSKVTTVEGEEALDLSDCDILFLGGGSDREQEIVCDKLIKYRKEIKEYAENGGVIIAVCGGYQLLGNFYQLKNKKIEGLGVINADTVSCETKRLIGNIILSCNIDGEEFEVAGFENHGGRTQIHGETPLGKVEFGFGNNGESGFEGVLYKNVFATYLHGPLLPKNPKLCDIILTRALKKKYPDFTALEPLDDTMEQIAFKEIKKRLLND